MNLGLGNLTELKSQLLAASLRTDTNYDAAITAIGQGVAQQFDRFCNRGFARTVGEQDIFSADRRHWYLRRFPVEAITECAKKDSEADSWVEYRLPPDGSSLIQQMQLDQGYVMFIAIQGYYWSRLRITYTAGFWFDTTEDNTGVLPNTATPLPSDVKLAWYLQCQHVWKRWEKLGAGITERPELSSALAQLDLIPQVKQLLTPFKRMQMT